MLQGHSIIFEVSSQFAISRNYYRKKGKIKMVDNGRDNAGKYAFYDSKCSINIVYMNQESTCVYDDGGRRLCTSVSFNPNREATMDLIACI